MRYLTKPLDGSPAGHGGQVPRLTRRGDAMTDPAFTDARIVIVDDERTNVILLEGMLERWGYRNVLSTTSSWEAPRLFASEELDLVLLDLHMPSPDGFELLEMLQHRTHGLRYLPVIVLSADMTAEAKRRALGLGAKDFVTKPFDPVEVSLRVSNLLESRRLHLELRNNNDLLEGRVRERTRELDLARQAVLERLAIAAEYRDDHTHEHAQRVGRTAALLALELGRGDDEVQMIRRTAPLHDIGKIGIPDAILLKRGKLSADEFEIVKTHTLIGSQILSGGSSSHLSYAARIARFHHERWDGAGYPFGLSGEDIPLCGRLVALADVFDALSHRRPYKEAWPLAAAVAEIERLAGSHFDPLVVKAFQALDPEALLRRISPADHERGSSGVGAHSIR